MPPPQHMPGTMDSRKLQIRSAKRPPEPDFEPYKPLIQELYLTQDKPLNGVMRALNGHGFYATKYQYEKALKRWGWTKNIPSRIWDEVCLYLQPLIIAGQPFEVYYYSDRIEDTKVCWEIKKCSTRGIKNGSKFSTALPPGMAVLPVRRDITLAIFQNLPFMAFEILLQNERPISSIDLHVTKSETQSMHIIGIPTFGLSPMSAMSPSDSAASLPSYLNEVRLQILQAVGPPFALTSDSNGGSIFARDLALYTSPLHRQVIFSLANNLAGLTHLNAKHIIELLRSGFDNSWFSIVSRAQRSYTTQALGRNLLQIAVEAGDADIVGFVLNCKSTTFDVNTFMCSGFPDRKLTPIERASGLQHRGVVEVLLRYGANVNLEDPRYSEKHCFGALRFAVSMFDINHRKQVRCDPDIFSLLLNAGGILSKRIYEILIEAEEFDLIRRGLQWGNGVNWVALLDDYLFSITFQEGDNELCLDIVELMFKAGVDVDLQYNDKRFIDIAARRGFGDVVQFVVEKGLPVTFYTLKCAIESCNDELVRFLTPKIELNVPARKEVLSKAIQLGQDGYSILRMFFTEGMFDLWVKGVFSMEAFDNALSKGSARTAKFLINHGLPISSEDLGYFLVLAAKHNEEEDVSALIDLGADTNVNPYRESMMPVLHEALMRKNAAATSMFLQAGADPDIISYRGDSALCLAVEWGNPLIVQKLLDAGADPNRYGSRYPLAAAADVAKPDLDITRILLSAGACLTSPNGFPDTALSVAVRRRSQSIVSFLLDAGADPCDELALSAAVVQRDFELCDLLLRSYSNRYAFVSRGFGSQSLCEAINKGHFDVFERIINAKINSVGMYHNEYIPCNLIRAPFQLAIKRAGRGDLRFVEKLLQYGYSTSLIVKEEIIEDSHTRFENRVQTTSFLAAVACGRSEVVKLFLKHGADVNYPLQYSIRRTPLQQAAQDGNLEIVQLLTRSGAQINAAAARHGGGTALQLAAIGGYNNIIDWLISYGADVNAPPSKIDGRTALQGAAEHGRLDTVRVLMNAGAAHNGEDHAEIRKAIGYAKDNHFPYICDLLAEYLPNPAPEERFIEASLDQILTEGDAMDRWDPNATMIE